MQQHPAGPVRIGIDLGGTKIEALALDAEGRELARRAHRHAGARLRADDRRDPRPGRRARGRARRPRRASASARRARSRPPPAWSRTPTRPGSTAGRSARDLARRARPRRSGSPTTPTASRSPRRATAPARARRLVFGVILGTGVGGGIVVDGRLWVGPNAIAGEWGHNALPSRTEAAPARTRAATAAAAAASRPIVSGPGARRRSRARRRGAPAMSTPRRSSPSRAPATPATATLARYAERLAARARDRDQRPRPRRRSSSAAACRTSTRSTTSVPPPARRARVLRPLRHPGRAEPPRRCLRRARRGLALASAGGGIALPCVARCAWQNRPPPCGPGRSHPRSRRVT